MNIEELNKIDGLTNTNTPEAEEIKAWGGDTKTIAKCEDMDTFDAEKGFAIALAKKFVGNERFRNMLEKYVWEVE